MAIGTPSSLGWANSKVSSSTLAMTVTANVSVGQFIVVAFTCTSGNARTVAFSDSAGNTWATDVSQSTTSGVWIGSAQVTNALTSGVSTITATISGGASVSRLICAAQVSGIATSTAFDKGASTSGTSTSWSSGATAATTQADELVIGACGWDSTATETSTPGGSYTELFDFDNTGASELTMTYLIVSATGAQTATGTLTNSGSRTTAMAVATYKGAASSTVEPFRPIQVYAQAVKTSSSW